MSLSHFVSRNTPITWESQNCAMLARPGWVVSIIPVLPRPDGHFFRLAPDEPDKWDIAKSLGGCLKRKIHVRTAPHGENSCSFTHHDKSLLKVGNVEWCECLGSGLFVCSSQRTKRRCERSERTDWVRTDLPNHVVYLIALCGSVELSLAYSRSTLLAPVYLALSLSGEWRLIF